MSCKHGFWDECEDCEELEAQYALGLLHGREQMKWKTIDSAPKDGERIILLLNGKACSGAWDKSHDVWCGDIDDFITGAWVFDRMPAHGCGCCGSDEGIPSHWMPLPPPPNA